MLSHRLAFACVCTLPPVMATAPAIAAAYPTKAVRIVVTAAPGGGNDFVARVIAGALQPGLGQSLVIDNRGGAGGTIATELVARAAPDGYTLLMCFVNFSIYPGLYRKLGFDPVADFAPISTVAGTPLILVVHPSLPAKSVRELVAFAKSRPGHLNYASTGAGSLGHLAAELFKVTAGTDMTHVSYKGGGPAVTALLSNEVQLYFSTMPAALPLVRAGRLRALAVSGSRRAAIDPNLPTIAEAGVPGYDVIGWFGLLAPAATAPSVVERLNVEVNRVLKLAEVRERLATEGVEPLGNTPGEFRQLIRAEINRWSAVVKNSGIKAE